MIALDPKPSYSCLAAIYKECLAEHAQGDCFGTQARHEHALPLPMVVTLNVSVSGKESVIKKPLVLQVDSAALELWQKLQRNSESRKRVVYEHTALDEDANNDDEDEGEDEEEGKATEAEEESERNTRSRATGRTRTKRKQYARFVTVSKTLRRQKILPSMSSPALLPSLLTKRLRTP